MRRFLHVLPFISIIFLLMGNCDNDQPVETSPLDSWPCTSTLVDHETYSEIIFNCPPGVWERMMAWHLAFHPSEELIVDP